MSAAYGIILYWVDSPINLSEYTEYLCFPAHVPLFVSQGVWNRQKIEKLWVSTSLLVLDVFPLEFVEVCYSPLRFGFLDLDFILEWGF